MIVPLKQGVMKLGSSVSDENNYLIGSKCRSCGAVAFPKRIICHKCRKNSVEAFPLPRRGKLASFTVAWAAPEGLKPPIALGYIDMSDGVRLLSLITGCEPSPNALELGQEMELVFEELGTDEAGNQIVFFAFRPVSKE